VKVITDFLMPLLIFRALYISDIGGREVLGLAGVCTFVVAVLLILSLAYCRIFRVEVRGFVPPVIFMNSGFLGIPLMKLWQGTAAMNLIVIYDQVQTLYIFTLGILIIAGGLTLKGFRGMVRSPILWAILAGFAFRFSGLRLPQVVLTTMEFGGDAAPPLAAVALGTALGSTSLRLDRHLAAALLFRFAGGFFAGLAGCFLLGISGQARTVALVASSLPSAVFTSVLPLRYGVRADFAGSMVVISTLLGIFTIPFSFFLAGILP